MLSGGLCPGGCSSRVHSTFHHLALQSLHWLPVWTFPHWQVQSPHDWAAGRRAGPWGLEPQLLRQSLDHHDCRPFDCQPSCHCHPMMRRAYTTRELELSWCTSHGAEARGTAALVPGLERGGRGADAEELSEDDRRGAGSTLSQNGYGSHTHTHGEVFCDGCDFAGP